MRSGTDPSPPCLSRSPAESGHHVPPSGSFLACPRTVSLGQKKPVTKGRYSETWNCFRGIRAHQSTPTPRPRGDLGDEFAQD